MVWSRQPARFKKRSHRHDTNPLPHHTVFNKAVRRALVALLLFCTCADAFLVERVCLLARGPHEVGVAPELYHLHRSRSGGSQQTGWMAGTRIFYHRRRPMAFYWHGSYRWAWGALEGRTGGGSKLKSDKMDSEGEARFGYSIGSTCGRWLGVQVTPYIGASYFKGHNKFRTPSPMTIHFRDRVELWNAGIIASIDVSPCVRVAVDYTSKWMVEGKNRTSNDPIFPDSESVIGNEVHHTVEVPVTVLLRQGCRCLTAGITPFHRHRHYGHHEAFPFDFVKTQFREWGANVSLALRF